MTSNLSLELSERSAALDRSSDVNLLSSWSFFKNNKHILMNCV